MKSASAVAGLVLAAGSGTRLGGPKAVRVLGGRRLVDRATDVLAAAGCTPVVVVSGAVVLDVPGAQVVHNSEWSTGMGSSLSAGISALPGSVHGVCVLPVDVPGIGAAVVRRLLDAFENGHSRVVVATYGGTPGNPAVLHRSSWVGVCELATGDEGARAYLRAHPQQVSQVECADIGNADDIDTPEQWAARTATPPAGR